PFSFHLLRRPQIPPLFPYTTLFRSLYVDKNLQYHGLIQAYSRTNRILNEVKSHGNIVCYRNLKEATDKAIELFANKDAVGEIIELPYEALDQKLQEKYDALIAITPTVDSVNTLQNEEEQAKPSLLRHFVKLCVCSTK